MSNYSTKKLINKIIEASPDIIHLHNVHGYYLNVKLLFDFLADYNKPVVWTLHDCWSFTGHCAYFSYVGCDKWKSGCKNCPQKKSYPASILLDNSNKNYTQKKLAFNKLKNLTLVTPSYWLADTVKQSFLSDYTAKTIYNGIDLEIFKPTESDFKKRFGIEDKKILLGVANIWEPRKGFDDFISLSKIISDEYVIVMVGLNKDQIKGLPSNIIGIERTESITELAEIYSSADVYINTSVEETMGLTTVEALATGTPAIVYDKTAVPEIVDEKSGVVISAGDVQGIYDAVCGINIKAEDCVNRAREFEKNDKYGEYYNLYKEILSKNL
jgi:glycosyltransferase involved in cell wall biosynthesis